jgi:hypothetical protein
MGMMDLQMRARQGDPQAIAMLQELQGGGMPAQGMPPQGMTQSQFGGGGRPIPADIQARRAKQLIEMLRARDAGMNPMQQGY